MTKNSYGQPVDIAGNPIRNLSDFKAEHPNALIFDSKYEWRCYKLLEESGFNFKFHPETRQVVPGFTSWALSKGKSKKIFKSTVRPIHYTPDFAIYCNNGVTVFVEAKGFFHKDARLRYKLFQACLSPNEMSIIVFDKAGKLTDMQTLINVINDTLGGSTISEKPQTTQKEVVKI
jgi:hypothetical protein